MVGIYILIPGAGGGSATDSSSVSNSSTVPGATVTDALNNLEASIVGLGKYVPYPEYTLTSTDITNKFITLAEAPTDPTKTQLFINEGLRADYGTDYVVVGSQLSWNGLNLFNDLQAGDKITVITD